MNVILKGIQIHMHCHFYVCDSSSGRSMYCRQVIALAMNIRNHFDRIMNQQMYRTIVQITLPYPMPSHLLSQPVTPLHLPPVLGPPPSASSTTNLMTTSSSRTRQKTPTMSSSSASSSSASESSPGTTAVFEHMLIDDHNPSNSSDNNNMMMVGSANVASFGGYIVLDIDMILHAKKRATSTNSFASPLSTTSSPGNNNNSSGSAHRLLPAYTPPSTPFDGTEHDDPSEANPSSTMYSYHYGTRTAISRQRQMETKQFGIM